VCCGGFLEPPLSLELDANLHLLRRASVECPNLFQQRVTGWGSAVLIPLVEAKLFLGLANLAERAMEQSECVMGSSEVWKLRARLAVGIGRACQVMAGSTHAS
jgi:hypothetical protein